MTPEAVALLLDVKRAVLDNPDRFNMDYWFAYNVNRPTLDNDSGIWEVAVQTVDLVPAVPLLKHLEGCGTSACAAGWCVALSGEKVNPGESIEVAATRLLGYKPGIDDIRCPLFFATLWPCELADAYEGAESFQEAAEAFAKAVDLWIEVDGDPEAFSMGRLQTESA